MSTTAPVKRYRMSYRDGIREDDGTLIWPADASKQMVLAEHYDAACAKRDAACKDANEEAFRCDALAARVERLEALLRDALAEFQRVYDRCDLCDTMILPQIANIKDALSPQAEKEQP